MATEIEKRKATLQRITAGDKTALNEFRKLLQDKPEIVETYASKPLTILLERINSLTKTAAVDSPLLYREVLTAKMDSLRAELSGTQPSAIERLLVERIVVCWLQLFDADFQVILRGEAYDLERQAKVERRYLAALRSLAAVRRVPIKVDLDLAIGRICGNSKLQSSPEADRIDGAGRDCESQGRLLTTQT